MEKVREATQMLRSLLLASDRQVIVFLSDCEQASVKDIYTSVGGMEQSQCSSALGRLLKMGMVQREQRGRNAYYSVCPSRIQQVNDMVKVFNNKAPE
jgi:DNA-binding transcriptional ArsR family regulator